METIPSSATKKGLGMDEIRENEVVMDEQINENVDFVENDVEADNGFGLKMLAGCAAAAGIAAGVAWKHFGPAIKAKTKETAVKRLNRKNEKLANRQLKIQAKINQLRSEEAKKEE